MPELHTWESIWRGDPIGSQGLPISQTYRMKVPGGWLYRHHYLRRDDGNDSMVFVPDPLNAA
jgi:hypothetical protein